MSADIVLKRRLLGSVQLLVKARQIKARHIGVVLKALEDVINAVADEPMALSIGEVADIHNEARRHSDFATWAESAGLSGGDEGFGIAQMAWKAARRLVREAWTPAEIDAAKARAAEYADWFASGKTAL